eukprot:Gb_25308 [translate_table: standard]
MVVKPEYVVGFVWEDEKLFVKKTCNGNEGDVEVEEDLRNVFEQESLLAKEPFNSIKNGKVAPPANGLQSVDHSETQDGFSYKENFIFRCYEVGVNHTATIMAMANRSCTEHGEGKIETRRDWILKDVAIEVVIGRATSTWLMMNQDMRWIFRVTDDENRPKQLQAIGNAKSGRRRWEAMAAKPIN